MLIQLVAPVFYAIAFVLIISRWKFFKLEGVPERWTLLAFAVKILAGFAFWAVYTFYYDNPDASDAFRYFADAQLIKLQWYENRQVFWSFMFGIEMDLPEYRQIYDQLIAWTSAYRYGLSNDCSTIIRINVLISFVSFGSFHVHALFMAFMSMIGMTAMFRAFQFLFSGKERILFFCLFAIPSVVFWSSSLLKEGPLFCFLGMLLFATMRIFQGMHRVSDYLIALISLVLLLYIKGYVIIALIPGLLFLVVVRLSSSSWIFLKWLAVHLIGFAAGQQGHVFFRGGDFLYVLHKKQVDFYNVAYLRDAGSLVEIPPVTGVKDFIMHYPNAFALTYLRPTLWESSKPADLIFAFENALLMLLMLGAFIRLRKVHGMDAVVLLMLSSFILVLAAVLGNTVPILGAIVRYKAPALPFIAIICCYFVFSTRKKIAITAKSPSNK
jgi:hypothetical protein